MSQAMPTTCPYCKNPGVLVQVGQTRTQISCGQCGRAAWGSDYESVLRVWNLDSSIFPPPDAPAAPDPRENDN